jgi:hypothetical protein
MVSLLAFPVGKREEWEEGAACPAPRNGTSLGLNPSLLLQGGWLLSSLHTREHDLVAPQGLMSRKLLSSAK